MKCPLHGFTEFQIPNFQESVANQNSERVWFVYLLWPILSKYSDGWMKGAHFFTWIIKSIPPSYPHERYNFEICLYDFSRTDYLDEISKQRYLFSDPANNSFQIKHKEGLGTLAETKWQMTCSDFTNFLIPAEFAIQNAFFCRNVAFWQFFMNLQWAGISDGILQ